MLYSGVRKRKRGLGLMIEGYEIERAEDRPPAQRNQACALEPSSQGTQSS